MKLLQIIKEEIVPLSSRQNLILLIIIACSFQFFLFFSPLLAEEAMAAENSAAIVSDDIISLDIIRKDNDPEAATLIQRLPIAETKPAVVKQSAYRSITAYTSEAAQTDASPCITANGFNVCEHGIEDTIAANFLKFGTKVRIPELYGDRVFVVRDRMNSRYTDRVDIWMKDKKDAIKFGYKVAKIEVLE